MTLLLLYACSGCARRYTLADGSKLRLSGRRIVITIADTGDEPAWSAPVGGLRLIRSRQARTFPLIGASCRRMAFFADAEGDITLEIRDGATVLLYRLRVEHGRVALSGVESVVSP